MRIPSSSEYPRRLFLTERPALRPGKIRVWIAEEQVADADFLNQVIGRPGIAEIQYFLDGRRLWAALMEAEAGQTPGFRWPDILLLDPHLPVISGGQILGQMRLPREMGVFLIVDDLQEHAEAKERWPAVEALFARPLSLAHVAEILNHSPREARRCAAP